jgi:hypothetical protein
MTSAQGEVIDPQHPRHRTLRQRYAQQIPAPRCPARLRSRSLAAAGQSPASQLTHDTADLLTEPDGASLVSLD